MSLGILSIDIEARLAKLEQGMDKATRLIEQRNRRIEGAFASASAAAQRLVGVIAALGVGAFARSVLDGVDALNDFADATGTSVENASALEDVALRTGTSVDTVSAAMVRFNAQLAAAGKPGSEAARVFELLGLDAARLRDSDPADALLQTAQALAQFADDGNKARLVQELFGKSVRDVAPFLKDLADAGRLTATVTSDQAKAAEDFNKALFSMQKNVTDLARSLLGDALPAMQRFLRELNAARESGGIFSRVFRWQRDRVPGGTDTENLTANRDALREVQQKVAAIQARMQSGGANQFRADQLAGLQERERQLQQDVRYYERLLGITNVQGGRGSVVPGMERRTVGALPEPGKAARAAGSDAQLFGSARQSLADALAAIEGADETKLERLREQLAELVRMVTRGVDVPASAFADTVEAIAKLDPAARAAAKAQEELARIMDEGRKVFEDTRTPAEQLAAELARLQTLLDRGAISWDTYGRAQEAAQQRFDDATAGAKQKTKELSDTARDLGMTFSSAFEDAIVSGQKFSDVLKAIEKDIVRIVTRNLVTQPAGDAISKWIQGGMSAGSGGGAGAGFNWGAMFASLFQGWFADGGYIRPGRWGMAGERGPEPVYGGRTGVTVAPNRGAVMVSNTFVVQGGADLRSQNQIAALTARSVARASARYN